MLDNKTRYTLGIDIGSTTVKTALLNDSGELLFSAYERHYADIQGALSGILKKNARKRQLFKL